MRQKSPTARRPRGSLAATRTKRVAVTQAPRLATRLVSMLAPTLAGVVIASLLASCGLREAEAPGEPVPTNLAAAQLPLMATIGGAQDVWPFSFGLDVGREVVESVMGAPAGTDSRPAGTDNPRALVVTWNYPGVSFTFFVDEGAGIEDLLVARVDSPDFALRGGLGVGMTESDALALLGEPGHRAGDDVVYFYYSTTIELVVNDGRVTEIALARAMP